MIEERRHSVTRLRALQYLAVGAFTVLAAAFWFFQVVQFAKFRELSENNYQRTLRLRAPRGMLFDRDGKILVENVTSYTISIVRENAADLDRTVRLLASTLGLDEDYLVQVVEQARKQPAFQPIVVLEDATLAQVAAVRARRLDSELPEVVVEQVPIRRYPSDAVAAHLIGYVGEARSAQIEAEHFRLGTIVGQSGIEQTYNSVLMGEDGERQVVVNVVGREVRTLAEQPPTVGHKVQLTIDLDVQRALETGFQEVGYAGAAVLMDPRNGDVLALTSLPAFDPNDFVGGGIARDTWDRLSSNRQTPLQNRAIQGRYSPGSTFKLAVAAAALQEGIITPDFRVRCTGGAQFYGRYYRCHLAGGHGSVNMVEAIEHSCNVYFYTVGNMLGVDKINEWAEALGLGVPSEIDLPSEVQGLVPSTSWKREVYDERWYPGETISVSIGQGQVSITPISLAVMMSTIANGGIRWRPRLVRAVDEGGGWRPLPSSSLGQVPLLPETVEALHEGLWRVVNGQGTGRRARIAGRDVAGKTGTAQVISLEGREVALGRGISPELLRDHRWFVFFAPRDEPEIAGVVFVEHPESGTAALEIAKHAMLTYFAKQDGQPIPEWPGVVPAAPAGLVADQAVPADPVPLESASVAIGREQPQPIGTAARVPAPSSGGAN